MAKAVLFDYDGTLLDSIEENYKGVCNVFRMSGIPEPTFTVFFTRCLPPFTPFYRDHGVTASPEEISKWYFQAARNGTRPFFPDVAEVLKVLCAQDVVMGIISAHWQHEVMERCNRENLLNCFQSIVGRAWNKVEAIHNFCSQHDMTPSGALYVGDTISDMRDAKEAGVVAVGITRGRDTSELLRQAGADHCISDLHELLTLL